MFKTEMDSFITESSSDPAEAAKEAPKKQEEAVKPDASDNEEVAAKETAEVESDKQEAEKSEQKETPKKKTAEERIAEITKARREAERLAATKADRVAELEARLAALEDEKSSKKDLTEKKQPAKEQDQAPNPDDFEFGELDSGYITAREEHLLKKARASVQEEFAAQRQAEAAERRAQEVKQKYETQIAKGVAEFDDFESSLAALDALPPVDSAVAEALLDSEVGHKIIDHLAKNAKEVAEISKKSPIEQARYLGKLEAQFSSNKDAPVKKQEPKISKAPEPVDRSRGGDGRYTVPPDTDDFAAFEAAYGNKKQKG